MPSGRVSGAFGARMPADAVAGPSSAGVDDDDTSRAA